MIKCDILVIGAGASGMMAAITAARNGGGNIIMLDGRNRVGKKLLTTGNGRCNIANISTDISHYHSTDIGIVSNVLNRFTLKDTERFFSRIGIKFKQEEDKLFPYSLQAASVLDVLRFECERLGVTTVCDSKVTSVSKDGIVKTDSEIYQAKAVIIACGGKAAPSTGSDGSGYSLLKSLGHSIVTPQPAIVPLRTELSDIKALKGVRIDGRLTLKCGSDSVNCDDEILFTDYGISGPAAMHLSRFVSVKNSGKSIVAVVDFLPELNYAEVREYLNVRKNSSFESKAENLTLGLLHKRVGQAVLKKCALNINDDCTAYTESQIMNICSAIKKFTVKVTGVCGFDLAQTTAGGARLAEFDSNLCSKLADSIFACGEVLDCDGDCGGFNLQWAWSSGYVAGISASERLKKC